MANEAKPETPEATNARIQKEIRDGVRPGHDDAPTLEEIEAMTVTHPEHVERGTRDRSSKLVALFPHLVKE